MKKGDRAREEEEAGRKGFAPRIRASFDLYCRVYRMTASINHLNGGIDKRPYEPSDSRVSRPNSTDRQMNAQKADFNASRLLLDLPV